MQFMNTDNYWRYNYDTVFFKNIYKKDIEHISKWTHGKTLSIGLETQGVAMVDGMSSLVQFQLVLPASRLKFGPDEFDSTFLKNTGLQYVYTREFELIQSGH